MAAESQPGLNDDLSISDGLRNQLAKTLPLPLAEAVLSPFVIVEFLFRDLFGNALGYLVPLLIAGALGAWMVFRMRREVTGDELALSDRQGI